MIGAKANNLKGVDVDMPLGTFTCVTGVSGSGKSTLVNEVVVKALNQYLHHQPAGGTYGRVKGAEALDKMVVIDQSPIGRTPRSNPATYTGAFDQIRELYSLTPEAKMRGYTPGRFSFNVKGGRCEACQGDGIIKIEMHFLPDVYVPCEVCKGKRYNAQTLEVKYKNKSIADVLAMRVDEAAELFSTIPKISNKLKTICEVGLGYIHMGQPATQLSGGEAQRIKLATELSRRATGRTFYVLDEPTTGLHFADIHKLLDVLSRLVAMGNTVLVIEHNLDVIKTADYVIDLGPEGGDKGGHARRDRHAGRDREATRARTRASTCAACSRTSARRAGSASAPSASRSSRTRTSRRSTSSPRTDARARPGRGAARLRRQLADRDDPVLDGVALDDRARVEVAAVVTLARDTSSSCAVSRMY